MREKIIEQHLVMAVKNSGGIAPKLVSPGFDGMPDRLVLLPGGKIGFVEVKAPGKEPRPLQVARHGLLRRLGFKVYVLDAPEQIGGILDEIRTALVTEVRNQLYRRPSPRCRAAGHGPWENEHHTDRYCGPAVRQLRGSQSTGYCAASSSP